VKALVKMARVQVDSTTGCFTLLQKSKEFLLKCSRSAVCRRESGRRSGGGAVWYCVEVKEWGNI
jgi:hypothetical protein